MKKTDNKEINSAESVIVTNVDDAVHTYTLSIGDTYIAFNPNQIKSATENIGSFDYEKSNIYKIYFPNGSVFGSMVSNLCII